MTSYDLNLLGLGATDLFLAVGKDDLEEVRRCLKAGTVIDKVVNGMTALHVAVGRNNPEIVRLLLESGAAVQPDGQGRWPSIIALECEASDEICDMVEDAEARLKTITLRR